MASLTNTDDYSLDSLVGTLMQQLRENPPEWLDETNATTKDDSTKAAIAIFEQQHQDKHNKQKQEEQQEQQQEEEEEPNFSDRTWSHWRDVSQSIGKEEAWYNKAEDWWSDPSKAPATVDGVLGGFAELDPIDVKESIQFLKDINMLLGGAEVGGEAGGAEAGENKTTTIATRALDGGAGIGRVAKHLLSQFYTKVDLVEGNQRLIDAAPAYMAGHGIQGKKSIKNEKDDSESLGELYCNTLQDFIPTQKYDCIWIQWVIIYLTDVDLISFLKRCSDSLNPNGVIIIKENVLGKKNEHREFLLDEEDSSLTRSKPYMKWIFEQSKLEIFVETKQENWHRSMLPVMMYALVPQKE